MSVIQVHIYCLKDLNILEIAKGEILEQIPNYSDILLYYN